MQLIFLGTASCYPNLQRAVSCTLLRFEDGQIWMFDCGEGSQLQLQKITCKPGKITKIFISHLHGDHLFGLPGIMCTLTTRIPERPDFTLEIYGPKNLRKYIRDSLLFSFSVLNYNYVVHELEPVSEQYPDDKWNSWPSIKENSEECHPNEIMGKQIRADSNLIWEIFKTEGIKVQAGPIIHSVPCFGYVLTEDSIPGKLNVEKLTEMGITPGPIYNEIKKGKAITINGIEINPKDVIGPWKPGRKVSILSDTKDASKIKDIAENSDVVIHETTLENALEEKALVNGHSTPKIAVSFAESINAKTLIITHFSQRYKTHGENSPGSLLKEECINSKSASFNCEIIAAEDLMEYTINRPDNDQE